MLKIIAASRRVLRDLYKSFKKRVLDDGGDFYENEIIFGNEKLLLTPNAVRSGMLYSAIPNNGVGDFTVVRNSTASCIDQSTLIQNKPINYARIDYRDQSNPFLLVEDSATNFCTQSVNMIDPLWIKGTGDSLTAGFESPDGGTNGFRFGKVSEATWSFLRYKLVQNDTGKVCSFFIKNINSVDVYFRGDFNGGTNQSDLREYYFNFSTEVISDPFLKFEKLPNGWFRFWYDAPFNSAQSWMQVGNGKGEQRSIIGQQFIVYGAQIEMGTTASSYIPTSGSPVTRDADNISVNVPDGVTEIKEYLSDGSVITKNTIPNTYTIPMGMYRKITMI